MNEKRPERPDVTVREEAIAYFQGRSHPFTQKEMEQLLSVSRFTLLKYRRDGVLKAFVRGNVLRFHVEDVYRFLMSQTA